MKEIVVQHISTFPRASAYLNSIPVERYAQLCGIPEISVRFQSRTRFKALSHMLDGSTQESTCDSDSLNMKTEGVKMVTLLPSEGVVLP